MARPFLFSPDDPPYTVTGTVVKANPGNWIQGQEPLHDPRYIYRWSVDGSPWSGEAPPARDLPSKHYAGEGADTLDFNLSPGTHQIRFQVIAGNYLKAWGDIEHDWIEWGADRNGTPEGRSDPYVVGLTVTVPGAPPPPPPPSTRPPTPAETKAKMISAARQWENGLKQQAPLSRITLSRRILQTTDAQWTPEIAAAVAELINPT